jgi:serine/threonine-protein kinase
MNVGSLLSCLDENTVAALLDGLLTPEARWDVDAHVDSCVDCRLLLSNIAPLLQPASVRARPTPSHFTISRTIEHDRINWNASMRVGRLLRDKWRLDKLLGVGGTAAVYEAAHKNHGGRVAIKVIHAGLELDPGERRRFLREGYAANAVGHPGIVRVIDDDVDEDGSLFLVSELVVGETLHARLGRLGPLPVHEVLAFADAVLDVLVAAHERGIIHRDIKPENILVTTTGETKLLDFGMALVREATYDATVTTSRGLALGTPAFMPPEQALGLTDEIGPTTDIWSVGATMFTLMSGRLVHDANTVTEAIRRAVKLPAPALGSVLPNVPEEVCRLVDRALAFAKEDRWTAAYEMQAATREALAIVRPRPPEVGSPDSATIALREAPTLVHRADPHELPAKRRLSLVWVSLALVGIAVPALWWTMRERPPRVNTPPLAAPAMSAIVVPEPPPSIELPSTTPSTPSLLTSVEPPIPSLGGERAVKASPRPTVKPHPSTAPATAPPTVGSSWLDRRTR